MRSSAPSPPPVSRPAFRWSDAATFVDVAWKLATLLLLAWIAWNAHVIRKNTTPRETAAATTTTQEPAEETATVAPVYEPDLSSTRIRRIAAGLKARPPRGIRVPDAVLANVTADELARVAVEISLRRNRCHTGTDAIDGKLSAAEQRATRNCTSVQDARLMKDRTEPDTGRAVQWLEDSLVP
jgi:hypothetical protein